MADKKDRGTIEKLLEQGAFSEAATAIVETYGPEILTYLRGILRDDVRAKEVFSEWGERLWTGLPTLRSKASVRTWAFRVAWCAAFDHRRRTARRREQRLTTTEVSRIVQVVHDRTPTHLKTGGRDKLDAIRATLDPEERSLLHLRVDRKLSWDQIAEIMSADGEPVEAAALRKRYQRLREKLHTMAERAGLKR